MVNPTYKSIETLLLQPSKPKISWASYADVAKLADALDLGSSAARRVGSTPSIRTITIKAPNGSLYCYVNVIVTSNIIPAPLLTEFP